MTVEHDPVGDIASKLNIWCGIEFLPSEVWNHLLSENEYDPDMAGQRARELSANVRQFALWAKDLSDALHIREAISWRQRRDRSTFVRVGSAVVGIVAFNFWPPAAVVSLLVIAIDEIVNLGFNYGTARNA